MLLIRDAQMDALRRSRCREFENAAVAHWTSAVPGTEVEAVRAAVQEGIRHAVAAGLEKEDHIMRFLNLERELGAGFHSDPAYPWAGEILGDGDLAAGLKVLLWEERAKGCSRGARSDVPVR